ncbi:hypothetical protein ILUMI_18668, partial [Ignelater luminosus]
MKPKIKTEDTEESVMTYPPFYNQNDDIEQTVKTEITTESDEQYSITCLDNDEAEVKSAIESEIKIEGDEDCVNNYYDADTEGED